MQPYIIGIDIGTGSTKAAAVDTSGKVIATSQFYYPMVNTLPGFAEQNPELIWEAFVNCIKQIKSSLQHVPKAVCLSSCMHSLLVIDRNHKALSNLITWADTRSEKIASKLRKSSKAENIYKATGTPIHSMSPLCKIIWLKKNEPAIFKKAFKYISIKEFIWRRLFDVYEVDHSIASATGLFNIKKRKWNNESLKLCGINEEHLSNALPVSFIRTGLNQATALLLNISPDTPFCIGGSDGCLANIGSFAFEPGIAAVTIGTSGAVRIVTTSPVFNFSAMIFNYILEAKTFVCGGPINNGGNVVQWLFNTFLNNINPNKANYEKFFSMIEAIPAGSDGLLFLPYINGERAPIWDEKACGVFVGIKSNHNNSHFLRAGLEGICYALKHVLQILEESTGTIKQLNVSGGFVNAKTWMQVLADITGVRVCLVQTEDASAIGAALVGMKAMNIIDDYSSLKQKNDTIIEPNKSNQVLFEKYFLVYKKIYEILLTSIHKLYDISKLPITT